MEQIRAQTVTQVRAVNRDERTLDIVASDFSVDSYNTRIDPQGWDLEQFRKNPVILLSHNDWNFPVAQAVVETIRIEDGKLRMTIRFPKKGIHDDADKAFELYADGFMRGVSVGFDPVEHEDVEEGEGDERIAVRIYRKQKLLEVSLVTIPSNDNALAQRAKKLGRESELDEIKNRTLEFEKTLQEKADHSPDEVEKWRRYFEEKKPANKASTKVLKAFFAARGEKQPEDEVAAWTRMNEIIEDEATVTETTVEEETSEDDEVEQETVTEAEATEIVEEETETEEEASETTEETTEEEAPAEESEEEEAALEADEEPSNPPVQEAPEPERKAYVQIPLTDLAKLRHQIVEACVDSAMKASRQGIPKSDWDGVIDVTGRAFGEVICNSISN